MYQQSSVVEKKPVSGKGGRSAKIRALMRKLEEANKDPEFRKAARAFIKCHTS